MNITLEEALTKVPTRDELWQVLQEARDYLSWYLQTPDELRVDPKYGEVVFDASIWGREIRGGNRACFVCLAGIWYLRKLGVLLNDKLESTPLPPIADYLDDMRYPVSSDGTHILGIDIPEDLEGTLLEGTDDDHYYEDNPAHVLLYLDWLLAQRTNNNEEVVV